MDADTSPNITSAEWLGPRTHRASPSRGRWSGEHRRWSREQSHAAIVDRVGGDGSQQITFREAENLLELLQEEAGDYIESLEADAAHNIASLEAEVGSRTVYIERLEAEAARRRSTIDNLQHMLVRAREYNEVLAAKNDALLNPCGLVVTNVGGEVMRILDTLADGRVPDRADVNAARQMVRDCKDFWTPINLRQSIAAHNMEADVARSLISLLAIPEDDVPQVNLADLRAYDTVETAAAAAAAESDADVDAIPRYIVPEVEEALRSATEWTWDAFKLQDVTAGRGLSSLAFWLFQTTGVTKALHLNEFKLAAYLRTVEDGYGNHPYHNAIHASDVLQTVHKLITTGGVFGDAVTIFGCMFAAVVHDLQHTGYTNDYLVTVLHDHALTHNDSSPQENHHAAQAFRLLERPELSFMEAVPPQTRLACRKQVISMILATDMKCHFDVMSRFGNRFDLSNYSGSMSSSSGYGVAGRERRHAGHLTVDSEDRNLIGQVLIKIADLSHTTACWDVHLRWVRLLEEEFFLQGDAEMLRQLPVSPLMNRHEQGLTKSQVGFFEVVVKPMFAAWSRAFPHSRPLAKATDDNYNQWVELQDET